MTDDLRLSEVVAALSHALDITDGQPLGHAVRSCLIGMRLADELDVDPRLRGALYYGLLLKDAGCTSERGEGRRALRAPTTSRRSATSSLSTTRGSARRSPTSSATRAAPARCSGCSPPARTQHGR